MQLRDGDLRLGVRRVPRGDHGQEIWKGDLHYLRQRGVVSRRRELQGRPPRADLWNVR